uniref:MAD2L1-binding protein n=1 Tax=Lygus hesperus TaxID=30085 RepID=A0A0A9YJH6_LYGHE
MSGCVELELGESLSRRACAVVIKHIIKFIAYNNQQIPYTYDGFQQLVVKKRRLSALGDGEPRSSNPLSFKQIRANTFYDKIETIYNSFETTFRCIEDELVTGNVVNEILVILGATIASPKHLYRIQIPELSGRDECDKRIRSHLFKIYRSIVSSGSNQFSGKCSGLTNIFILINGDCKPSVESGWFIPKFDFRVSVSASQTLIKFVEPSRTISEMETCESVQTKSEHHCCDSDNSNRCDNVSPSINHHASKVQKESTIAKWYLAKQALSGFQDMKIDGVSVYNVLSGFDS